MKPENKTPEKRITDSYSLQVPAANYETSEKQKQRMLLKSWAADNNQFQYKTEKKPQTTPPIKSRLV